MTLTFNCVRDSPRAPCAVSQPMGVIVLRRCAGAVMVTSAKQIWGDIGYQYCITVLPPPGDKIMSSTELFQFENHFNVESIQRVICSGRHKCRELRRALHSATKICNQIYLGGKRYIDSNICMDIYSSLTPLTLGYDRTRVSLLTPKGRRGRSRRIQNGFFPNKYTCYCGIPATVQE